MLIFVVKSKFLGGKDNMDRTGEDSTVKQSGRDSLFEFGGGVGGHRRLQSDARGVCRRARHVPIVERDERPHEGS